VAIKPEDIKVQLDRQDYVDVLEVKIELAEAHRNERNAA
jgi:septum formation topological specificity factor MinE